MRTRFSNLSGFATTFLLLFAATAAAELPLATSAYQKERVSGFTVHVNPEVKKAGREGSRGLGLVRKKLADLSNRLPKSALVELRKVPLFVEWKRSPELCISYHFDHSALGGGDVNIDKVKAVEIADLSCFSARAEGEEPLLLLREYALAHLDRIGAWKSSELESNWQKAKKEGLYEMVPFVSGGMREARALTSAQVFFAESSESLFGANDHFPFNTQDLARIDRASCDYVEKLWGARGHCDGTIAAKAAAQKEKAEKKQITKPRKKVDRTR